MPAIRNTRSTLNSSAGPSQDPARPRAADSELETDERYAKGDFRIIARQPGEKATLFRLPSFYMLAASSVIRDTYEIGTGGSTPELEVDAATTTVRSWLDLLTDNNEAGFDFTLRGIHPHVRDVLRLCQQFDCSAATKAIMAQLESSLDSTKIWAVYSLITAAMFGAPRPFEKAIRTNGDREKYQAKGTHEDLNAITPGAQVRNPSSWSLADFCLLPPTYCWALLRSYSQTKTKEEQADRLKVLLALIEDQSKLKPAGDGPAPDAGGSV